MNQQNQGNNNNNPSLVKIAATIALGYGAYKIFESVSKEQTNYEKNQVDATTIAIEIVTIVIVIVVVGVMIALAFLIVCYALLYSYLCVNWIWCRLGYYLYLFGALERPPAWWQRENVFSHWGRNQTIHVIDTVEACEYAVSELEWHCEKYNVLGFDCEWVSDYSGRKPVALLQLNSYQNYCALIRLSELRHIPSELRDLLQDKRIIKVGVAPYADANFLFKDYGIRVASTLDLRFMAEKARCIPGSLSNMFDYHLGYLGFSLDKKSSSSRCSNWEELILSKEQIEYAAIDVYAAVVLFVHFAEKIAPGSNPNYIRIIMNDFINENYGPYKFKKTPQQQKAQQQAMEQFLEKRFLENFVRHLQDS